jgi:hypothetical protein
LFSFRHATILLILLLLGCEARPEGGKRMTDKDAAGSDTAVYREAWNVGHDMEEPENSFNSRFSVRVTKSSSGKLKLSLDSAVLRTPGPSQARVSADSVEVTGLTTADRFTQGCRYTAGNLWPMVGVLRDSVYERQGRPRFVWHLDTLNARIRRLSSDSASCFIAGPE